MAAPPWRSGGATSTYTSRPGFTSVDARRTLGGSRTGGYAQSQPTAQSPTPRTTFPDKLKQYVARTFEDCSAQEKPEVEAELKRIITDAFNEKVVWTIEWEKMPLPQAILAKKKAQEKEDREQAQAMASQPDSPSRSFSRFSLAEKKRKSNGEEIGSPSKMDDRFDKRARHENNMNTTTDKLNQRERDKRARRFGLDAPRAATPTTPSNFEFDQPLVGRCLTLEKKYFRLTAAPDPETVRPLHVLEKTLELLKKKWRKDQNYSYICDQFKSLRQDLTVQHIKSEFTVLVYEIHARIALEKGDLGEYNQCQTQLASLYGEGFKGHEEEFKAYRILYLLHTCNRADMNDLLANLTHTDKQNPAIKHALQVRSVLAAGNYHRFFRLYLEAPNMGGYLMDSFIVRERMASLAIVCKAYRPDIDIRFLTEELGFESDTECVTFLCDHGAQELIEQKSGDKGVPSSIRFQTQKAYSIFEAAKQQAFRKVDIKGQV